MVVIGSSLLEIENKLAVFSALFQQGISRLLCKGCHVTDGARVGSNDSKDLTGCHVGQGLFRLDDR